MDISILLNKTVTNLWDKTQVQAIKTIIGASQAPVGRAASCGAREEAGSQVPSSAGDRLVGGVATGLFLGTAQQSSGQGSLRSGSSF